MHSELRPSGADRRAHPRFRVTSEIEVQTSSGPWRATLEDLSLTGARLSCANALGAWGDNIIVGLHRGVGLETRLELPGTIVRTELTATGHHVGIRFDALESSERLTLTQLLARLQRPA